MQPVPQEEILSYPFPFAEHRMISFRIIQAIGGSFLMANSTAILIDAFPVHQRGMALHALPMASQAHLLDQSFFPNLISSPLMGGMRLAFYLAAVVCFVAAMTSLVCDGRAGQVPEAVDASGDGVGQREGLPASVQQG